MTPLLTHQLVAAPSSSPSTWIFVLHGVFGMGTNFRAIAKQLTEKIPEVGYVLVDLRGHGASQGFAPPHSLASAANDLEALRLSLGLDVRGIIGHSFGGKVALAYLKEHPLEVACILDSMPGPRKMDVTTDNAANVLQTLETIGSEWSSREDFKAALAARGFSKGIVEWLTMNVRREGDAYGLRLDLPAIRSMLEDYFAVDLWPVLECPGSANALSLVIAGRSTVFDAAARERAARAATSNPALEVIVLETAGHWVHVDDPGGVIDAVVRTIRLRSTVGT